MIIGGSKPDTKIAELEQRVAARDREIERLERVVTELRQTLSEEREVMRRERGSRPMIDRNGQHVGDVVEGVTAGEIQSFHRGFMQAYEQEEPPKPTPKPKRTRKKKPTPTVERQASNLPKFKMDLQRE